MVARFALAIGQPLPPGPNAFGDDDGNAHEPAINALAAAGVLLGDGNGSIFPNTPLLRGQLASAIVRYTAPLITSAGLRPPT